ncbi:hypothetical protein [Micromonospora sp. NPDC050276]|uniref:hypothetical protein n=1 Tax=Micromonospora sp. NPDC050276 TaxID=3364278 RepID=UPI00378DC606
MPEKFEPRTDPEAGSLLLGVHTGWPAGPAVSALLGTGVIDTADWIRQSNTPSVYTRGIPSV